MGVDLTHATYLYLLPAGMDPEREIESMLAEYGDDNNWYQVMGTLTPDGALTQLCPDDDYRGRNMKIQGWEQVPPAERWAKAIRFSAEIVASDSYLPGVRALNLFPEGPGDRHLKTLPTRDAILHWLRTELPKALQASYAQQITQTPEAYAQGAWQRRQMAAIEYRLVDLTLAPWRELLPFRSYESPYKWRCFYHTSLYDKIGVLEAPACPVQLVFVDVHT